MNPQQPLRAGQPLSFAPPRMGSMAGPPPSSGGGAPSGTSNQMNYGRPPVPFHSGVQGDIQSNDLSHPPDQSYAYAAAGNSQPFYANRMAPPGRDDNQRSNLTNYRPQVGGQPPPQQEPKMPIHNQQTGPLRMPPPQPNVQDAFHAQAPPRLPAHTNKLIAGPPPRATQNNRMPSPPQNAFHAQSPQSATRDNRVFSGPPLQETQNNQVPPPPQDAFQTQALPEPANNNMMSSEPFPRVMQNNQVPPPSQGPYQAETPPPPPSKTGGMSGPPKFGAEYTLDTPNVSNIFSTSSSAFPIGEVSNIQQAFSDDKADKKQKDVTPFPSSDQDDSSSVGSLSHEVEQLSIKNQQQGKQSTIISKKRMYPKAQSAVANQDNISGSISPVQFNNQGQPFPSQQPAPAQHQIENSGTSQATQFQRKPGQQFPPQPQQSLSSQQQPQFPPQPQRFPPQPQQSLSSQQQPQFPPQPQRFPPQPQQSLSSQQQSQFPPQPQRFSPQPQQSLSSQQQPQFPPQPQQLPPQGQQLLQQQAQGQQFPQQQSQGQQLPQQQSQQFRPQQQYTQATLNAFPPTMQSPASNRPLMPPTSGAPTGGYGQRGMPTPTQPRFPQQREPQKSAINPDAMPNPINELRSCRSEFPTNVNGVAPPTVMTSYTVKEAVNCSPRFLRSSMYNIPISSSVMKETKLPLSVCIQPFSEIPSQDEHQLPIVNTLPHGPVRCNRCRGYINPFVYFIDNGQRFLCNLCNGRTDVPQEYFCHVDHRGVRADKEMRAELNVPSYEFIVNQDYCRNNKFPETPAFVFVIDVSYNSIQSGMVNLLCRSMLSVLDNLPCDSNSDESEIRIGIVTFNKTIQIYNLKDNLNLPQMLVITDTDDVFIPLVDGFFVKPTEARQTIEGILEQIPAQFQSSRDTETVLGQAVKVGFLALKEAERSGKILLFSASLPTAAAPGRLRNREDRKAMGTDKEKGLLHPQIPFYSNLAKECVTHGVGVDLFLFPNGYIDVATIGDLASITGGSIYKYSYFTATRDGARFCKDLATNLQRFVGFDAIMRLRTSAGIRPTDFYGNFHMANVTDIELATVDSSKSFNVIIKHDDNLEENRLAHMQVALLYTSINGERRLRIHNISFTVGANVTDVFKSCDLDTILSTITKIAVYNLPLNAAKAIRDDITTQCAQALASYRKHCSSNSPAGQLILPECLKLLPVFINSYLNSDLMRGVDISFDDKCWLRHIINSMKLESLIRFLYPRLVSLHNIDLDNDQLVPIRCSREKLEKNGAYLLDNGLVLFLWIGSRISSDWLKDVFGITSFGELQADSITYLQKFENPLSERINHLIAQSQAQSERNLKLTIIKEDEKMESWFNHFLVEDRYLTYPSYVDYLCYLHKQIRELID